MATSQQREHVLVGQFHHPFEHGSGTRAVAIRCNQRFIVQAKMRDSVASQFGKLGLRRQRLAPFSNGLVVRRLRFRLHTPMLTAPDHMRQDKP